MKLLHFFQLASLCICLLSSLTLRADYPIVSHRYLADPAVLVHDGRVYLYCSNDDENDVEGGYVMKSFVCVSSKDLKNWTDHGVVFEVPTDASWAGYAWAPSVIERNGKIYMYFSNGASGIGVVVSDSPTGPFSDPIGGSLINSRTAGAAGENMWLFDPAAFIDDDGQAYLYFGGNGESNVRVIKLNEDMISVSGSAQSITAPGFFEASWMNKRNGIYYFSYSTNPSNGMRIDYMTSSDPMSGFSYAGVVAGQPPNNYNNNHHGIFEFEGQWYHVFHNRYVAGQAGIPTTYKRNLGLEPLSFGEDGSIVQITYTRDDLNQVMNMNPYVRVEGETFAAQSGIETDACSEGGMALANIANGDWVQLRGVDFEYGVVNFQASIAASSAGSIEVYLDNLDEAPVMTCAVDSTGGLDSWSPVNCEVNAASMVGKHDVYFKFISGSEEDFMGLDWWQFEHEEVQPPENLSVDHSGDARIELSWDDAVGAVEYAILRSMDGADEFIELARIDSSSYSDQEGLVNGHDYYYVVRSVGQYGYEASSDMVIATPVQAYGEWIAVYLPEEGDEADLLETADPDRDGRNNSLEYLVGSNPFQSDSVLPLELVSKKSGGLEVRLRVSKNLKGVQVRLFGTEDLLLWNELNEAWTVESEGDGYLNYRASVSVTDASRYFVKMVLLDE